MGKIVGVIAIACLGVTAEKINIAYLYSTTAITVISRLLLRKKDHKRSARGRSELKNEV